ncbi:hypothetical protein SHL15_9230 [Streptomyces hygroscopicus subsp. limoneus]|nr:hypothetical protein SHL15_9230 [Streptomyces hygroscopicus subsp. limoneus]
MGVLSPEDCAEVARLPRLTSATFRGDYLPGLLSAPHLPTLEFVQVMNVRKDTDLTPLSRCCPQVQTVQLYPEQHSKELDPVQYKALFPQCHGAHSPPPLSLTGFNMVEGIGMKTPSPS